MQKCDWFIPEKKRKCKLSPMAGSLYCRHHINKAKTVRFTLPRSVAYIEEHHGAKKVVERDMCPADWLITKKKYGGSLGARLQDGKLSEQKPHGWIYIFSVPSTQEYWKIGHTTQSLSIRMKQWRSSGHGDLKLEACWYVPYHSHWIEGTIHMALRRFRYVRLTESGRFERYDGRESIVKNASPCEVEWFRHTKPGKSFLRAVCREVIEQITIQVESAHLQ